MVLSKQILIFITMPARVLYDFIKALFCMLLKVDIVGIYYFQVKEPLGEVEYRKSVTDRQLFWLVIGPFLICSFLSFIIGICGVVPFLFMSEYPFALNIQNIFRYIQIYLGFSIGVNAFPSREESRELLGVFKREGNIFKRILGTVLYLPVHGIVAWSHLWTTAAYALFCILVLPYILIHIFA